MWSNLRRITKLNFLYNRTFLSEAYKCEEAWDRRLSTPIITQVNLDTFYFDLDQKNQQKGQLSAVDVDVYANAIKDDRYSDELSDLLLKLRLTTEASNMLPSTGHALVRNFLKYDQKEQLINILETPLNYGVFMDNYTANLAIDQFIKAKDYHSAARIATFVMLQEDFASPITKLVSLYCCYQYARLPKIKIVTLPEEKTEEKPKKKIEEVKVRVNFLRNDYFDDHFDLRNIDHLVGKTFTMIGRELNGKISNSSFLIGHLMYQKYDEAEQFVKQLNGEYHTEAIHIAKQLLEQTKVVNNKNYDNLVELVSNMATAYPLQGKNDLEEEICRLTNESVATYEAKDIEIQQAIYERWLKEREEKLNAELKRLENARKLKEIETMTKEMVDEEQKLWFFENEDKIDLQIEGKKVYYPKRWFGKKKKPRVVDEGYIPPEVRSRRN